MDNDVLLKKAEAYIESKYEDLPENIERIPSIVANNASLLLDLSQKVKEASEKAKNANSEATKMKGFEEKRIKIFSKDIVTWKSGDIKEITEEHQRISKSIAAALELNTQATSLLFDFQKKLADAVSEMFYLGCFNLALNEAMINSLKKQIKLMKEAKKGISKQTNSEEDKLSNIAKEEFLNLVRRLKQQRNFLLIQSEHGQEIKKIKNEQSSFLAKTKEQTSTALAELEKKSKEKSEALHKEHQAAVSNLQETVNKEVEQMKSASDRLEKEQNDFITKTNEQTSTALNKLQEQSQNFIEEKNSQFEKMEKQLYFFKILSLLAISASIISAILALI